MEQVIGLLPIGVLLILSGFFSGSETALFSLPATKLASYRKSSNPRLKLIAALLEKPRDLLVTVFMLNTLVNILLQNVTSAASGTEGGWFFKVIVPFLLLLIFGEIIPKYIGMIKNVSFASLTAPLINLFQNLISPIRRLTVLITIPVTNALFFYLRKEASISRDEMKHVLKKSEEHGVLHPDESELVWGYLNLQDILVKEVMRPREQILSYDINEPISKLKHLFIEEKVTRIPVCEGDLQNTIGIITARNFFLHQNLLTNTDFDLRAYLTKPLYIPEATQAKILLRRLDALDREMALVVDEYGAISGLITYEDVVEIVIGEIIDQRDTDKLYTMSSKTEMITSGKLELLDFNQIFDVDLDSPNNMVTIGGWLTEKIGTIPKSGMKCEFNGFAFNVLAADQTHIKRIYVRKL